MSQFTEDLIAFCLDEWHFFGHAEINLDGTVKDGRKEYSDGAWQRIAEYWQHIGGAFKDLTGKHRGTPWSAAFVSFAFHQAGAADRFPYSAGHASYINTAIRNADKGDTSAPIIGRGLRDYELKPGDLIGYWRGDQKITMNTARKIGWYQSHCDIVIDVQDGLAHVIGGNVMNTVTRRQVRLNSDGNLVDDAQNWFVAIDVNF